MLPSFRLRLPAFLLLGLCALGSAFAAVDASATDDRPVEDAKKAGLQQKSDAALPTLWIIGDSTVKVGTPGQRGWGDELAPPINEDPPVGKSTRARGTIKGNGDETVFVEKNILTGKPETVNSYGWYLRNYVTTAKEKGASAAIICSLIPRKNWNDQGKVNRASGGYGLWAKQAAEQSGAFFVDLNEIVARAYEKIGPEAVDPLFGDRGTHTSPEGAKFNARAVVSGLNGLGDKNPLAPYLSAEGKSVPAFVP
jgi:rhamnogalacturonan acetylesterase